MSTPGASIEIISEASRHLSDELKARHPEIPWPKVAGIGNVLRHDYELVAHDVLWRVVRGRSAAIGKVAARSWRGSRLRTDKGKAARLCRPP
jgi:uncharacterized protein with HEPN domain